MKTVRKGYEDFYKAVCAWNHKKNIANFKYLFSVCGEKGAYSWQKLWFIIKNTINHRYKEIERDFQLPIDN